MHAILYDQDYPNNVVLRGERMRLWAEGIDRFGGTFEFASHNMQQFGDFGIAWGPRSMDAIQRKCLRHVIMECGFLGDRLQNFFVGYAGLNGAGRLPGPVREGRGEPWRELLQPLKNRTHKRVVILGQVARDANLLPLSSDEQERPKAYRQWVEGVARLCRERGMELGFRGHPSEPIWSADIRPKDAIDFDAEEWTKDGIWHWADLAIAFSSNSLVEAFLAGVDVLPGHPASLTWDVRSSLSSSRRFSDEERVAWLDKVASFQWSAEEIRSGEAYAYLQEHI